MTTTDRVKDIATAMAAGTAMVCATCTKFWEGQSRGTDRCTAVDGCGSPIVGDTFHEYEGPITDFLRFCFVCGDHASKGVRVGSNRRVIGACGKHVDYVVTMAPKLTSPSLRLPLVPPSGSRIILAKDGSVIPEDKVVEAPKRLSAALMQMEAGTFKPDS